MESLARFFKAYPFIIVTTYDKHIGGNCEREYDEDFSVTTINGIVNELSGGH